MSVVRRAGFGHVQVGCMFDVFSGSARESDAKEFQTRGIVSSADKP